MINKRTIVILCALIAVLIALFVLIGGMESLSNVIGLDGSGESVVIFEADSDDVTEITVSTPDETFTFIKSDGTWKYKNHEDIAIDETKAESLAGAVAVMNCERLIEKNSQKLSDYGLENPKYFITAKIGNETKTFCRGDKTPIGDSYYFTEAGSKDVYSQYSSKCETLFAGLEEYRSSYFVNIDVDNINYIKIKNPSEETVIVKSEKAPETVNGYTYSSWETEKPVKARVDEEKLKSEVINKIGTMQSTAFVDDDGSFEKYGLDSPSAEVTVKDSYGASQTFLFGNTDEQGNYYAAQEGCKSVYLISADAASFINTDSFSLLNGFLALMNFSDVSSVYVKSGDKQFELTTYKNGKDAYILNGKKIAEKKFRSDIYQSIIGLMADGYCLDAKRLEPEAVIEYRLRDNGTKRIEFVSYDSTYYAVFTDGECSFKIKKSSVNDMIANLEKHIK